MYRMHQCVVAIIVTDTTVFVTKSTMLCEEVA